MSGYDGATYNCNGHDYPRVSNILSILDKGYGLEAWKQKTIKEKLCSDYYKLLSKGADIDIELLAEAALKHPNTVRDARGSQGTNIHDALEALLDKNKDHAHFLPEYQVLYDNAQAWITEAKLEPIAIEARLCSHDFEYGGTCDLIAYQEYKGEKQIALIDFKTGSSVYDTSTLQLAAYSQAYREQNEGDSSAWPDICYIMHVNRDTYKFTEKKHIHRYNPTTKRFEIGEAFSVFKAVRACYRWRFNK